MTVYNLTPLREQLDRPIVYHAKLTFDTLVQDATAIHELVGLPFGKIKEVYIKSTSPNLDLFIRTESTPSIVGGAIEDVYEVKGINLLSLVKDINKYFVNADTTMVNKLYINLKNISATATGSIDFEILLEGL